MQIKASAYSKYNILVLTVFTFALHSCTTPKVSDVDLKKEITEHIQYLASDDLEGRAFGTRGELKAAEYIASYFKNIGLESKGTNRFYQEFNVTPSAGPHEKAKVGEVSDSSLVGRNVIGFVNNKAERTVVIGAHFDHLGMGAIGSLHRGEEAVHNGADDNASGVATILALAKLLKAKPAINNYLFITFTGEENGLWGSNYFTKNSTIDIKSINYMLNFDMVGRLNDEKSLAIHGTGTSPGWEEALNRVNTDSLSLIMKPGGVGPSDHTSFYLNDIPVLHFFTGQHEDYHKPTDDVDKINYDGIISVIRYTERLIDEMESTGELAFTKTKDESADTPRFKVTLGVVPDYLFNGEGMRIDGVSEGKPAESAGMQKGDVVVKLGDSIVVDMMSYMKALSVYEKGDSATILFKRDGEAHETQIVF